MNDTYTYEEINVERGSLLQRKSVSALFLTSFLEMNALVKTKTITTLVQTGLMGGVWLTLG
ncbi:hypothetical protein JCM31185_06490 [Furfurilactobacillus curtus]|uniref:Uncharacterized protein n=1 Tax=Furfurilactobacillus curtus TaxID=1746200 RepID=A0ABQ5JME1_9LACO